MNADQKLRLLGAFWVENISQAEVSFQGVTLSAGAKINLMSEATAASLGCFSNSQAEAFCEEHLTALVSAGAVTVKSVMPDYGVLRESIR